jgi:hypothetical protein
MASPTRNRRRQRRGEAERVPLAPARLIRIGVIALLAILVAAHAGLTALAGVARARNPGLIARLTSDPLAPVHALDAELRTAPDRIGDSRVAEVALESLRGQALSTAPYRLLALHYLARQDTRRASAFAAFSERLSRRDLTTQLFLIEEAVRADDTRAARRHYDIALRTSDGAKTILFPVLSGAIANAPIRRAVVPYIRGRAPWARFFVHFAVQDGDQGPARAAALLIAAGAGRQADLIQEEGTALFDRLVEHNQFALAERVFLQVPGNSPQALRTAGFTQSSTVGPFGPLAWKTTNTGSVSAAFEGGGERRAVRLFASSGERGIFLRRVLKLPPGRYRFTESRTLEAGSPPARVQWEMKCGVGRNFAPFWQGPANALAYRVANAPGPTVPANCPYQVLELHFYAGDGQQGIELRINGFDLAPAAG